MVYMDTNNSPARWTESARPLLGHKQVDNHRPLHRKDGQHTYRATLIVIKKLGWVTVGITIEITIET